jgi:hypothetical protein
MHSGIMSAVGTKRTSDRRPVMSAFGGKADMTRKSRYVWKWQDLARCSSCKTDIGLSPIIFHYQNQFLCQRWSRSPCPLWVKIKHDAPKPRCPLFPQKRTLTGTHRMSAKCHKRTSAGRSPKPLGHDGPHWGVAAGRIIKAASNPLGAGCRPSPRNRTLAFRSQCCESHRDDPRLRNWPIPLGRHRHLKRRDKPPPQSAWGRARPTRSDELIRLPAERSRIPCRARKLGPQSHTLPLGSNLRLDAPGIFAFDGVAMPLK